jgi:ribonuclease J
LFNRTVDNLFRQGANVLYHELGNVHVSGHGGQEDYLRMFNLTRPQYFIPVHGEYRHLVLHARLAQQWGLPAAHVFILEDGDTVEFGRFAGEEAIEARRGEKIEAGHVYVDGLGVGDIGNVVLRDRRQLSQEGFIVCIVAVDEYDGEIIYGPEIISRGFVYMREQEDLIRRAQEAVSKLIKKKVPATVLENKIKDALGNFAAREIGRRPMVLPLVIEM